MNKLLEIKDKAVKFCGEYEHFILPVVRFAVAFIAFITIDLNIGYMAKISSMLVALLFSACVCTASGECNTLDCFDYDTFRYVCAVHRGFCYHICTFF